MVAAVNCRLRNRPASIRACEWVIVRHTVGGWRRLDDYEFSSAFARAATNASWGCSRSMKRQ